MFLFELNETFTLSSIRSAFLPRYICIIDAYGVVKGWGTATDSTVSDVVETRIIQDIPSDVHNHIAGLQREVADLESQQQSAAPPELNQKSSEGPFQLLSKLFFVSNGA